MKLVQLNINGLLMRGLRARAGGGGGGDDGGGAHTTESSALLLTANVHWELFMYPLTCTGTQEGTGGGGGG